MHLLHVNLDSCVQPRRFDLCAHTCQLCALMVLEYYAPAQLSVCGFAESGCNALVASVKAAGL